MSLSEVSCPHSPKGVQMYTNSAYLHNCTNEINDHSKPLLVTSCGLYRLYTIPEFPTWRPKGRLDYQLLYIASGRAHFLMDGKDEIVTEGHMVLYRPGEPQKYVYYCQDHTEVYWVHFTGSCVEDILRSYGFSDALKVIYCGSGWEYQNYFLNMIQELQMCNDDYEEMLEMQLRQLLIKIHRYLSTEKKLNSSLIAEEIKIATAYFSEKYNQNISIEEYAASRHMSTCWFIRNFKQYIGSTPMQYILSIRISNAMNLLENTEYNITEISSIVGYDNPLYFSRIFKKQKGVSPSDYRKTIQKGIYSPLT